MTNTTSNCIDFWFDIINQYLKEAMNHRIAPEKHLDDVPSWALKKWIEREDESDHGYGGSSLMWYNAAMSNIRQYYFDRICKGEVEDFGELSDEEAEKELVRLLC